eukprot:2930222-Pyramimonas_sp.AAC.1
MPPPSADTKPPHVSPTVKGKCFSPPGQRTCCKPFHSCLQRVITCSQAPGSDWFQIVGRAARDLPSRSEATSEVYNTNHAADEVRRLRDSRPQKLGTRRGRCTKHLSEPSVVVADADQAFEQCSAAAVSQ